ncbi:MAG: hypothetical protein KDA45_15320, partial [Planctomycetales bacterium]|nr:hypothetical protein [Planctomycetales bacterium]
MSDRLPQPDTISQLQRLSEPRAEHLEMAGDAELLELYVESGSRPAMEALIRRYTPLVASVCRLTVADRCSAEDAFQATFLVLLKSADRIRRRASLAAWLHGVAYRPACRLRNRGGKLVALQEDGPLQSPGDEGCDPLSALARKMELEALDRELE